MAAEGTIWGGAVSNQRGCASRIAQGRKNVQILPGSVDFKIRSNAPLSRFEISLIANISRMQFESWVQFVGEIVKNRGRKCFAKLGRVRIVPRRRHFVPASGIVASLLSRRHCTPRNRELGYLASDI